MAEVREAGYPALTSVTCFVIAATSFKKNHLEFEWTDWTALVLAFVAIGNLPGSSRPPLGQPLSPPLQTRSVTSSTVKKGWKNPESDSVSSFALNAIKFIPSIFAMNVYSIATVLVPHPRSSSSMAELPSCCACGGTNWASSLGAQASHGIPRFEFSRPPPV